MIVGVAVIDAVGVGVGSGTFRKYVQSLLPETPYTKIEYVP